MKGEILLMGIHVVADGELKPRPNYYPDKTGDIMDNPIIIEALNRDGFTRLLYCPQYSEKTIRDENGARIIRTKLGTTLSVETKDKSTGRKKWETIGHVCGVSDQKLEEMGFQKWEKNDYETPTSKIEITRYDEEARKKIDAWLAAQDTTQ
jgi:hypothetical protein